MGLGSESEPVPWIQCGGSFGSKVPVVDSDEEAPSCCSPCGDDALRFLSDATSIATVLLINSGGTAPICSAKTLFVCEPVS
jgi:hypothetical protein